MKKILLFIYSLLIILVSSCNSSFNNELIEDAHFDKFTISNYASLQGLTYFPSIGTNNLLVIPLLFKNHDFKDEEIESIVSNIDKAFFANDLEFESVSSYYEKSSYGKLKIVGEVVDPITIDKTVEGVALLKKEDNPYTSINENYYDKSYYPTNFAIEELKKTMDLSIYDNDKDGIIDGVYFIYIEDPYSVYCNKKGIVKDTDLYNEISSLLWAFTYFFIAEKDINTPNLGAYSFSSYKFMNVTALNPIDSHIYIHETGHMLGLNDYYNYNFGGFNDDGTIDYSMPIGGLDMMDLNIGDHNAYSKLLLGWIKPLVIDNGYECDLKSFAYYDEALIIPLSTFNYSPFSSYLIIEYYVPEGVNEFDSKYKYLGKYPTMFKEEGFIIYRVNSYLGLRNKNLELIDDFTNVYENASKIDYITSNTPYKSVLKRYYGASRAYDDRLLTLISPYNNDFFKVDNSYRFANDNDLFKEGLTYTYSENNINININILKSSDGEGRISVEVNK